MAVEIRELIIKAIVTDQTDDSKNSHQQTGGRQASSSNVEKSLKLSVEKVMDIIRNKNER
jgi:hypothetical protein